MFDLVRTSLHRVLTTPTGDGFYEVSPASTPSACLDLPWGTSQSGMRIQQWDWHKDTYQQWNIVPAN